MGFGATHQPRLCRDAEPAAVAATFEPLDVRYEFGQQPIRMVALGIPAELPAQEVKALLLDQQADGRWDF